MSTLLNALYKDIHYKEGMNACINCGTCTAICPAADYYPYDPRKIVEMVQQGDELILEELLKSDEIWYCGECMSCKTRCPRNNTPGQIIMALRALAIEKGYFVESEKGRQQLFLKRTIGHHILETGYCLFLEEASIQKYPEQGPIWDWRQKNWDKVMLRLGANYNKYGPGAMRKIPQESLNELHKIFEITGALDRFEKIEKYSEQQANHMQIEFDETLNNAYINTIYETNEASDIHKNKNNE